MNKLVAVVIIAHKQCLEKYEKISLQQCFRVLGKHDIFLVCPEGLNISEYKVINPNVVTDFISPRWQSSYKNFNRLKILPFLYERYRNYEYILFYEADAFVFRDELESWCNKGYDYIGAPWFEGFDCKNGDARIVGVGNGGFSLRKVSSLLRVLNSFSYVIPLKENIKRRFSPSYSLATKIVKFGGLLRELTVANNTYKYLNTFDGLEDQFWGLYVSRKFKDFQLAPVQDAIAFSIEMQPNRVMNMNDNRLPFGCHAWWKYDLDFWKPHIEQFGYSL